MAMNETTQLGCGRDMDVVWSRIDLPPDEHERDCPDCQAARASLSGLQTVAQEMRTQDLADPTLAVDPNIFDDIVAIARAEVRRGRRLPLRQLAVGQLVEDLTVSEQTVAGIVRFTSDQIPGVETRRCQVEVTQAEVAEPAAPSAVTISLRVSVAVGQPIPELIGTLRSRTREAVGAEIGVQVTKVDIVVEDLHEA